MNTEKQFSTPPHSEKPNESSNENKLSPEVVEKIMGKVQDLNRKDTAYSVIYTSVPETWQTDESKEDTERKREKDLQEMLMILKGILQDGLLGRSGGSSAAYGSKADMINKERWFEEVRKNNFAGIYFNVVGRANDRAIINHPDELEILNSEYIYDSWSHLKIVLLFDHTKFKEISPNKELAQHSYQANPVGSSAKHWNENFGELEPGDDEILRNPNFEKMKNMRCVDDSGRPIVDTDYGFILKNRLAPRYFRGLMINTSGNYNEYSAKIAELMRGLQQDDSARLLPIYDREGNLLWPEKMSYEEIKKTEEKK